MAASKSAPERAVTRRTDKSLPKSGGRADTRKSVARRDPNPREKAKDQRPSQPALPTMQPETRRVAFPSDRYPRVDPTVLHSAMGRARKALESGLFVEWLPAKQQWKVPSATTPRRSYRVWKRVGRKGRLPFWVALECNCQAEQSGSYLVCWHKCAVKIRWDEELELRAALRKDVDEPPPDDDE